MRSLPVLKLNKDCGMNLGFPRSEPFKQLLLATLKMEWNKAGILQSTAG